MNDQIAEQPTLQHKLTDATLLVIAFAAIASWLWRRIRRPATIETATQETDEAQLLNDKVGAAIGFPPSP